MSLPVFMLNRPLVRHQANRSGSQNHLLGLGISTPLPLQVVDDGLAKLASIGRRVSAAVAGVEIRLDRGQTGVKKLVVLLGLFLFLFC